MEKRFNVEGMSCAACSASVERVVGRLDFVNKAEVNLLAKTLLCDYIVTEENTAKIIASVEKAGFSATLQQEKAENEVTEPKAEKRDNSMTIRLTVSAVCSLILMYIAMGHMLHLPFTDWLVSTENIVFNGILQLIFTVPVLVLNRSFFIKGFGILDTHLVSNPNFYICSAIELSKGTYRFIDYKTETSIPIYAAALKQTILASVRLYKIGTDDTFISYDVACRTLDGTDITAQLAQAINGWTINYEIVKVEV